MVPPSSARTEAARRLGIAYPLVQGPFGGGLSTVRLAATVSNLGGLGSYGAHVLDAEGIHRITSELRAATSRPFALNLWISDADEGGRDPAEAEIERVWQSFAPAYRALGVPRPPRPSRLAVGYEEQVEALLEARPPVFSFVFGVPSSAILETCRARGIVTLGAATTVAEARVLDEAGVDVIVATGFEAGGHRPSFLASAEDSLMGTFALVPLVADRVRAPVIAAGGIADGRGIRAAFALGAQGAQLGSAFLACDESGTTPAHRALLLGASEAHLARPADAQPTVLTRGFSGRLARGLRNGWTDALAKGADRPGAFPLQSYFLSHLRPAAVAAGNTDLVSLWGGQIAPNLRHRSAHTLMEDLLSTSF